MKTDLYLKTVLTVIAAALVGLLLRSAPAPAFAAPESPAGQEIDAKVFVSSDMSGIFVLDNGRIYRFKSDLGKPVASGTWR